MSPFQPGPYPERDAWFRSPDWDAAAQDEFERRLARARPNNRVQYRRIKGIALLGSSDPAVRAAGYALLVSIATADDAADHERVTALGVLAEHDAQTGRFDDAEGHLREALRIGGPSMSGGTGEERIRLAELLLNKETSPATEEAQVLLDQSEADMPLFVVSRFRLSVAQARASLARGDQAAAADWASAALQLAQQSHSGLRYHPALGLVEADTETLAWLYQIAGRR